MRTTKKMAGQAFFAVATGLLLSAPALTGKAQALETAYTLGAGNFPGGDTSAWTDSRNWSNGVPGPGDIASIGGSIYGHWVNVPAGVTLAGLNVGVNATLVGGSITVTGTSNWTGGDIRSALTIPAGVTLNIAGAADKILFNTSLLNQGTILWSGTGTLQATAASTLTNTGLIEARSDATLSRAGSGPSPIFTNTGIFRKSAGSGLTRLDVALRNSGTLDTRVGVLQLKSSVSSEGEALVFQPGSIFSGAGTTRCNDGYVNLRGAIRVTGKLELGTNSNLIGDGMLAQGNLYWTGGTLRGRFTVAPGTTMNIAGSDPKTLFSGSLLNRGTVLWSGTGPIQGFSATNIINSGLFEARSDAVLERAASGPSPIFTNTGTLRKSGGAGATRLGMALVNSGTLDTRVGVLQLKSDVLDRYTFNPGSILMGVGTTRCDGGELNMRGAFQAPGKLELSEGGRLTGNGTLVRGNFIWTGGTMRGSLSTAPGTTMTLAGTASKYLEQGSLLNRGTIVWSGAGALLASSATTITNSGLIDARSDATLERSGSGLSPIFTNTGTFRKSAGAGIKRLDMTLRNSGTFDIRSGVLQMYSISGSTFSFNAGSIFSGTGTTRCDGGSVLASGVIAVPGKLELSGFATLTSSATFNGTFLNRASLRPTLLMTFNGSYVQPSPGILQLRVRGVAPSQHDRIVVNGRVVLGGELRIAQGVGLAPGSTIVIIQNDGVDAIGGTFTGLREGSIVYLAGTAARISYRGGSGNDVTLSVPPRSVPRT